MEHHQTMEQDLVYSLAVSPNFIQDGLVFAAKKSGLYRSTEGVHAWKDAYASLKLEAVLPTTFVATAATDEVIHVYACVDGNVLRSWDGGESWKAVRLSNPSPLVTSLVVSPNFTQDGLLIAGTMQDGIFRSVDRGATWIGWNFGLFDPNINALAISPNFSTDQTILAGTQSDIFCSTNAGRSWRDFAFPVDNTPVLCLAIDQHGTIFAGTEEAGLFLSQDAGKTWDLLIPGCVEHIILGGTGNALIVRDGVLHLSKDGGRSWQAPGGIEIDPEVSSLAAPIGLDPGSPIYLGFSDGQVSFIIL